MAIPTTHKVYMLFIIFIMLFADMINSQGFSEIYAKMMFSIILMIAGIIPAGITYSYLDKKKAGNKKLKFLKYDMPLKLFVSPIVALFVLYPVVYAFSFAGVFSINEIVYSFVFLLVIVFITAVSTIYYKHKR